MTPARTTCCAALLRRQSRQLLAPPCQTSRCRTLISCGGIRAACSKAGIFGRCLVMDLSAGHSLFAPISSQLLQNFHLQAMGALGPAEEVTPLGEHLTAMPVDPRSACLYVWFSFATSWT